MTRAREIHEANLDAETRPCLAATLAPLVEHLAVSGKARTMDGWNHVRTFGQLPGLPGEQRASLRRLRATEHLRLCRSARFTDASETCIAGADETHILRGGTDILPPCCREQQLRPGEDGKRRAFRIACQMRNSGCTVIGKDRGAPVPPVTRPAEAVGGAA